LKKEVIIMATVKCSVCGGNVPEENALKQEYKGKTYYFCCDHCKVKFTKEPDKYAGKADK
jgi:YHS domain-containing protein